MSETLALSLWQLRNVLTSGAVDLEALPSNRVPQLQRQILFELGSGSDAVRAQVSQFLDTLNRRAARCFWRPRYANLVTECETAPSINHALVSCPTRFLGPLFDAAAACCGS